MPVVPYILATLIALVGSIEQVQLNEKVQASHQLKPGDSEAKVLSVLGSPRSQGRSGFFGFGHSRWIYGANIDLGMIIIPDLPVPNPVPIKLRIFGPCDGDLVVNWSDQGTVASIDRP